MLTINTDGIESKFKPAINNSIKYLESAESILSSIVRPPEFSYSFRIYSQKIVDICNRVNNVNNWVNKIIADFNNAENKNNNIINALINEISKFNISSYVSNTVKDAKRNVSTSKVNNIAKDLVQEGKENINQFLNDIKRVIENIFEFTGAIPATEVENMYKPVLEEDLQLTASKVIEEKTSNKNTSILDDPEIKQDLIEFNNILEFKKDDLTNNAEEIKNSIVSNYNPEIKSFIEEFYGSFENPSDINKMIFLLEDTVYKLESINPDECIGAYDSNTDFNMCYEAFGADLFYTKEDWEAMQKYLKENNLTWNDIIAEYKETISILKTYNQDLQNRKSQIYQLERYIELYPYTKITLKDDFKPYLERDYSNEGYGNIFSRIFAVIFGKKEEGRFDEFTQEEKAIYFYIKENYSKKEAEKYYDRTKDLINQRKAQKEAFEYIKKVSPTKLKGVNQLNDFLLTTGVGLEDGVVTFGENLINLIPGNGEIISENQYKQAILTTLLTQEFDLEEIEKEYGKDSEEYEIYKKLSELQPIYRKALGVNYNVACEIGELAIPMVVSMIPGWGQTAGLILEGASDAGAAKTAAYQNGITGWEAYLYAGIRGVTSALMAKSFGAIPGLSDNTSLTIKGILKGSAQAGFSAVAQSKMDLFLTKMFTGEAVELEEIFDLEQDAMTFVTAACTAFVLNGGKALVVKFKGQDVTITAEDIAEATNEDGSVDVDKFINLLIGKLGTWVDNRPSSVKIQESKNNIINYLKSCDLLKYIPENRIDEFNSSKIKIISVADFSKELNKRKLGAGVKGFYSPSEDLIYIPSNFASDTLTHETWHAIGNIYTRGDKEQINEAVTEYLKYDSTGIINPECGYTHNMYTIATIDNKLKSLGFDGVIAECYVLKQGERFKILINDLMDDPNFYSNLAKEMQTATDKDIPKEQRLAAETRVATMEQEFVNLNLDSYFSKIDEAVSILDKKYKGEGLNYLKDYADYPVILPRKATKILEDIPIGILKAYINTH